MKADKGFLYGTGEALVHGEAFAFPVDGVAQTAHLLGDGVARLFLPFPDFFNKLFSAQFFSAWQFCRSQFALNDHLRSDARMVGAHLPQGIFAFHAVVAGEGVHNAVLQGVADMQAAGHIRWGYYDAVGIACAGHVGGKITALFPSFIPFGFYILGSKYFFHYRAR